MAASTAARSRKPQPALNTEDALALRAAELAEWAKRNVRVVIAAAAVVLLLVLGLVWNRMQVANTRAAASAEFLQIQQTAAATGETPVAQLQQLIDRRGGTLEAAEARLMLGQHHIDAGEPQQAIPVLREVARGSSPLAFSGAMLLGAAQDAAGEREAAIRTYLDAADDARLDSQRYRALNDAALLREEAGDFAGAAETYRRMLDTVEEGSPGEAVVRMRIGEAEARAATPGA
jgi:predicted negative regulator of RcsB-dependent stress response